MYKLLLVSDQEDVLAAYDLVDNWDYNGFRKPHIRHDLEGAKDSLVKHHADGIILALPREQEKEVLRFLRAEYPLLPICEAGRTPSEALEYLGELEHLLNWMRADFSSDRFDMQEMMIRARRHFFRKLVSGVPTTQKRLYREMRLLRSRMDPKKPCAVLNLEQTAQEDRLVGSLQDSDHLLERELFQSFGGDVQGFHVLPLVTKEGKVFVLAGALRGQEQAEEFSQVLEACIQEGMEHAEEYRGLHLQMKEIQVYPSIYALCTDYEGSSPWTEE